VDRAYFNKIVRVVFQYYFCLNAVNSKTICNKMFLSIGGFYLYVESINSIDK